MGTLKESLKMSGAIHLKLWGPDGNLKEERKQSNLIVTVGKNHVADQMSDQGEAQMSHMAIGTGTTAAAAGDTTLETELDRNALTSATQSTNDVIYIGDWAAGDGTGAITEAGILNAGAAGTLLSRVVFSVVNKGALDVLQITWTITFG
jgi:hypothetical protein